ELLYFLLRETRSPRIGRRHQGKQSSEENGEQEHLSQSHSNTFDGAIDMLKELKSMKMSLETLQFKMAAVCGFGGLIDCIFCFSCWILHVALQSTRIGMSVNAVRKQSSDEEVQSLAKSLIKTWKKLLDGSESKCEEKKRGGSPLQSSSSKDSPGSSDFSKKPATPKTPTTPTTPTTPKFTSFPPAPVTTDSVRTKCRELLVAALQTDDDYKTIGADCDALAAEIEDYIPLALEGLFLSSVPDVCALRIYKEFKSTDMKYKARLRSRISNLKDQKNPDLRRSVLCGNIAPERIATMTAEEMASAELKEMRKALTKESIREHQLSKVGGTETDMFICGKCKGKSCTYTQVGTPTPIYPLHPFTRTHADIPATPVHAHPRRYTRYTRSRAPTPIYPLHPFTRTHADIPATPVHAHTHADIPATPRHAHPRRYTRYTRSRTPTSIYPLHLEANTRVSKYRGETHCVAVRVALNALPVCSTQSDLPHQRKRTSTVCLIIFLFLVIPLRTSEPAFPCHAWHGPAHARDGSGEEARPGTRAVPRAVPRGLPSSSSANPPPPPPPPRSPQVQTRSADEPMTTFVLCNQCGNRWKILFSPVPSTWAQIWHLRPLIGLMSGTADRQYTQRSFLLKLRLVG
ncbi:hypothetical protein P4O66_022315, partial [Electrophorus voltai]